MNRAECSDGVAADLIDHFGRLPPEVENLLEIIAIKRACRAAGVEKLEVGLMAAVISLRDNRFAHSAGLVEQIQRHGGTLKLRPDQKIVCRRVARREDPPQRRR